jgi:peptidoglycan/LPS O-acetylase OafA/YrhL
MRRANSFDLLRLIGALLVIYHHSFSLSGLPQKTLFSTDFGELGVGVFFVISGYLVTASYERSASLGDYLRKRLLRIEPALVVCLVLTVALGAAVTTDPAYFSRPAVYLFVVRDALLYPMTYHLPGVFTTNPYPDAVHGPIWTLRLEFTCYLGLAALGALKALRGGIVLALMAASFAVFAVVKGHPHEGVLRVAQLAAQYAFLFLAGVFLHRRPAPRWALASAVLLVTPYWILGLPVLVIALGELRTLTLPADVSYGLYIYAFPIQQLLAQHGRLTFPTAVLCTLPLAIGSWFLVEKPALRLKAVRTLARPLQPA